MAIASTVYVAGLDLIMLFAMQRVLRFDLCTEFGTVGRYVTKATCYALSAVFLIGVVVETGRLLVAL